MRLYSHLAGVVIGLLLFALVPEHEPGSDKEKLSDCDRTGFQFQHTLRVYPPIRDFVFYNNIPVYCLPDSTSQVLRHLNFGENTRVDRYVKHQGKGWVDAGDGFVMADAYGEYYISESAAGVGFYGKLVFERESADWLNEKFLLKLYDNKAGRVLQTYSIPTFSGFRQFKSVYNHTLKNIGRLWYHFSEFDACPGGRTTEFVGHSNKKLIKVLAFEEMGYDGEEYHVDTTRKVYLPIETEGKVILAPNGLYDQVLQPGLKLDVFPYNPSLGVPIEDLVVVKKRVSDNQGDMLKVLNDFYEWNGKNLRLVKTEKEKPE